MGHAIDLSLGRWPPYFYEVGLVHFISINTETDFPGAEETSTGRNS